VEQLVDHDDLGPRRVHLESAPELVTADVNHPASRFRKRECRSARALWRAGIVDEPDRSEMAGRRHREREVAEHPLALRLLQTARRPVDRMLHRHPRVVPNETEQDSRLGRRPLCCCHHQHQRHQNPSRPCCAHDRGRENC
jgi:hypothetical protein